MDGNSYKEQIKILRLQGKGYKQIANDLGINKNTVVYHCKRLDLIGVRGIATEKKKRNCMFCFAEMKNNSKYCSSDCRKLATGKNSKIECAVCKTIFIGSNRKFCSIECSNKIPDKLPTAYKNCLFCNVNFTGKVTSKFCSRRCNQNFSNRNKKHIKMCLACGLEFKTNAMHQKYCSVVCGNQNKINSIRSVENRKQKELQLFISNFQKKVSMFEYVGGYEHSDSIITIRCKTCNYSIRRNAQFLRKNKKLNCEHCAELMKKQKIQIKARKLAVKKLIRVMRKRISELNRIEKLKKILHCKNCGKGFIRSNLLRKTFCSDVCVKRFSNKTRETLRRKRLYRNGKVDHSITLEKLVKKHNGICCLCNNTIIESKGYQHPLYPSIDHIIPVSKGGTHTWDNVQLAHRKCNSNKSNESTVRIENGLLVLDF